MKVTRRRLLGSLSLGAGAIGELVVLDQLGQLGWATPLVIALAGGSAGVLALRLAPRVRACLVAVALAALLAAPAVWAAETLGHATKKLIVQGADVHTDALPNLPFARHQRTRNAGAHVLHSGGAYDAHLLVPVIV